MTEPYIKTPAAARKFLADHKLTDRAHRCYNGHYDCSTYNGGPCLDETLSNFACEECGEIPDTGISCPDGAFVCQQCFDQGAH